MSRASWADPPGSGSVKFFLERMAGHTWVTHVETLSPNRHDLTLKDGTTVKVFITDVYILTSSDLAELRSEHPDVNCILSGSSWNQFTDEAMAEAARFGIGTFLLGDLMGALNRGQDFLVYRRPQS